MDYDVIQSFARIILPVCRIIMHLYTELIFYDGSFEFNLLPSSFLSPEQRQSIKFENNELREGKNKQVGGRFYRLDVLLKLCSPCSLNRRCYPFIFDVTALFRTNPSAARTMRTENVISSCCHENLKLFQENHFCPT